MRHNMISVLITKHLCVFKRCMHTGRGKPSMNKYCIKFQVNVLMNELCLLDEGIDDLIEAFRIFGLLSLLCLLFLVSLLVFAVSFMLTTMSVHRPSYSVDKRD